MKEILPSAKVLLWHEKLDGVKCSVVEDFDDSLVDLVEYLKRTMYSHNGIGMAAPQIGVFKRVAVVHLVDNRSSHPFVFVNPIIVTTAGQKKSMAEGCLSLPGIGCRAHVTRPHFAKVCYQDIEGRSQEYECSGLMARAIMHEVDHLDGNFFVHHVSRMYRNIVIANHKKSLKRASADFPLFYRFWKDGMESKIEPCPDDEKIAEARKAAGLTATHIDIIGLLK